MRYNYGDVDHIGFRRLSFELPGQVTGRFYQSAVTSEDTLRILVEKWKPKGVIEIGTLCGISTIVLADVAEHVWTFDITERISCYSNWDLMNVRNKITYHICPKGREQIGALIKDIDADLAFVDAIHDYPNVKADFEIVKKCGRVLFHDAEFPGVKKFLQEIKATMVDKDFAYWEEGS